CPRPSRKVTRGKAAFGFPGVVRVFAMNRILRSTFRIAMIFFHFEFPLRLVRLTPIMAKPHQYKFCFGPWNISEGADPYGQTTRPPQTFDWKLEQLEQLGFDAMMFHDDDAVPDIDSK